MNLPRVFNDFPSVYDSFEEIPDHRKLQQYEDEFSDTDLWSDYYDEVYSDENHSERYLHDINRAGNRWKRFSQKNERHHAFTTPQLVNKWCVKLLETMSSSSANLNYFTSINNFYRYLMWNVEYPHWYNPVQFAVVEFEAAKKVWNAERGGKNDE